MPTKDTHIIDVKTKGAKKSQRDIKGVGGALGGLAKQAGIAALAYFGARGLLNALKSSLSLYAEQQLAEVKLESALGKTSSTLKKYATALQQTTRFGDELILQGMAQLAFFIKDEKQLKIATKATLDLASAKGMDLVQAADLVAKSVGSSTNALSRYGIAAEGAVGSEERLLSITNEIANLFGGQAEATTSSYQGALDQLSNSFGDMQEVIGATLAPTIKSLAQTFTALLSVPILDQMEKEREEFIKLTDVLQDVNTSETTRKRIITELQTLYPEYLGNLDLEKASMEDIKKMTEDATAAMQDRIVSQRFANEMAENKMKQDEAIQQLYDLEMGSIESLDAMSRNYMINMGESALAYELMIIQVIKSIAGYKAEEAAILENKKEFEEWLRIRLAGEEELSGAGDGDDGDDGDDVDEKIDAQTKFNKAKEEEYKTFLASNQASKEENELQQVWIKNNKEKAKVLGLTSDTEKKRIAIMGDITKAVRGSGELEKRVSQVNAVINTAEAVTEFISKGQWGRAVLAGVLGAQQIATIESAEFATGGLLGGKPHSQGGTIIEAEKGEFVMRKDSVDKYGVGFFSMLNAGKFQEGGYLDEKINRLSYDIAVARNEGIWAGSHAVANVFEGREEGRYQYGGLVEPLMDDDINGSQGSIITLNISGNVLTEEFTENTIIPQIKEGLRLGGDLGI